eukprot:gene19140-22922_t
MEPHYALLRAPVDMSVVNQSSLYLPNVFIYAHWYNVKPTITAKLYQPILFVPTTSTTTSVASTTGSVDPNKRFGVSGKVACDTGGYGIVSGDNKPRVGLKVSLVQVDSETNIVRETDDNGEYFFSDVKPGRYFLYFQTNLTDWHYKHFAGDDYKGVESYTDTFFVDIKDELYIWTIMVADKRPAYVFVTVTAWHDENRNLLKDDDEAGVDATFTFRDINNQTFWDADDSLSIGLIRVPAVGRYCLDVSFHDPGYVIESSGGKPAYMPANGYKTMCFSAQYLMIPMPELWPNDLYNMVGSVQLYVPAIKEATFNIGQYAWNDTNSNGIFDQDEQGIQGIDITISHVDGKFVGRTTTDAKGFFLSRVIPAGEYIVQCVSPRGLQIQKQLKYNGAWKREDSIVSTVNVVDGREKITIPNNNTILAKDYIPNPSGRQLAQFVHPSIGCAFGVYMVAVKGRVLDNKLQPQPNAIVALKDTRDNSIQNTKADNLGYYVFDHLKYHNKYCLEVRDLHDECFDSDGQGLIDVRVSTSDDKVDAAILIFNFNIPRNLNTPTNSTDNSPQLHKPSLFVYDSNYIYVIGKPSGRLRISGVVVNDDFGFGVVSQYVTLEVGLKISLNQVDGSDKDLVTETDRKGEYLFTNLTIGRYFLNFYSDKPSYHYKHFYNGENIKGKETYDNSLFINGTEDIFVWTLLVPNDKQGNVLVGVVAWNDENKDLLPDKEEKGVNATFTFRDMNNQTIPELLNYGSQVYIRVSEGRYCMDVSFKDSSYDIEPSEGKPDYMQAGGEKTFCFVTQSLMKPLPEDLPPYDYYDLIGIVSLFVPAVRQSTFSIGQYAWMDLNSNGIFDVHEQGIQGVVISISRLDGRFIGKTTTDAKGFFLSSAIPAGEYIVQCVPPRGLQIQKRLEYNGEYGHTFIDGNVGHSIDPSIGCGFGEWMVALKGRVMDVHLKPLPNAIVILKDSRDNSTQATRANDRGDYVFDRLKYDIQYCVLVLQLQEECFNSDGEGLIDVRQSTSDDKVDAAILIFHFNIPRNLNTPTNATDSSKRG